MFFEQLYSRERLAKFDVRWYMWMPTITGMICVPFMIATYVVEDVYCSSRGFNCARYLV